MIQTYIQWRYKTIIYELIQKKRLSANWIISNIYIYIKVLYNEHPISVGYILSTDIVHKAPIQNVILINI